MPILPNPMNDKEWIALQDNFQVERCFSMVGGISDAIIFGLNMWGYCHINEDSQLIFPKLTESSDQNCILTLHRQHGKEKVVEFLFEGVSSHMMVGRGNGLDGIINFVDICFTTNNKVIFSAQTESYGDAITRIESNTLLWRYGKL